MYFRWPLLVDPQGYATTWIKHMEKNNDLQIITTSNSRYIENLVTYMKLGKHVLLEGTDEDLDTSLDPILFKETYKEGLVSFPIITFVFCLNCYCYKI